MNSILHSHRRHQPQPQPLSRSQSHQVHHHQVHHVHQVRHVRNLSMFCLALSMSVGVWLIGGFMLMFMLMAMPVSADSHDAMSSGEVRSVQIYKTSTVTDRVGHSLTKNLHKRFSSSSSDPISSSMVVMVPEVTAGPYPEQITDYIYTTNLLTYGKAGYSGLTSDRETVTKGVPMNLTINLFNVSGSLAYPLAGAEIWIWHCDAIGVYSSVDLATARTNNEDTQGQYWLRGHYPTDSSGSLTYNTIIPGWYYPRAVHFHIRVRAVHPLTNSTFVVTTQLFPSQTVADEIALISPYSESTQHGLTLSQDGIYNSISASLASQLVLNTAGSTSTGFSATFNLGVDSSTLAAGGTTTATTTAATVTTTTSAATTTIAGSGTTKSSASSVHSSNPLLTMALFIILTLSMTPFIKFGKH